MPVLICMFQNRVQESAFWKSQILASDKDAVEKHIYTSYINLVFTYLSLVEVVKNM